MKVLYPKAGRAFSETTLFDPAAVREKYGVGPERIADLKAMVGDPSDNIPGIPGIGDKTAVKLIQEFGSLEEIYRHLEEVEPPRVREMLRENEARARRSKELATIVKDMPLELDLDEYRVSRYDRGKVADLFRELEFYSLLSKLPEPAKVEVAARAPDGEYRIVATAADLDEVAERLAAAGSFAFDTETAGLDAMTCPLVGISLAAEPGKAYYIPVGHQHRLDEVSQLPLEQVAGRLRPVLEDAARPKVAHNANFDMMVLANAGMPVRGLKFDTQIAAHLLGEKSLTLKSLAFGRLAIEMTPITDLIGTGTKQLSMSQIDIKRVASYSGADADMTLRLAGVFEKDLAAQGLMKLFDDVEMPLVPVLLDMEMSGIAVDTSILGEMGRSLGEQIEALRQKICAEADCEFNINSPQQLGKVLFEKLHIPTTRRGKGKYSTEASVLEELRSAFPIVADILQYRQLTKIKSTYIDTLPALVNPRTKRIHTSFNQTRTATGRLSSSDPNMQNIPVRGSWGAR